MIKIWKIFSEKYACAKMKFSRFHFCQADWIFLWLLFFGFGLSWFWKKYVCWTDGKFPSKFNIVLCYLCHHLGIQLSVILPVAGFLLGLQWTLFFYILAFIWNTDILGQYIFEILAILGQYYHVHPAIPRFLIYASCTYITGANPDHLVWCWKFSF